MAISRHSRLNGQLLWFDASRVTRAAVDAGALERAGGRRRPTDQVPPRRLNQRGIAGRSAR
jgi:hypothetical protein